jgi:hypothetical protein
MAIVPKEKNPIVPRIKKIHKKKSHTGEVKKTKNMQKKKAVITALMTNVINIPNAIIKMNA